MHCGKILNSMNKSNNNNNNLNIDFENAFSLSSKNFSHKELLHMLQNGSIAEKQIAALELDSVDSISDAKIVLSNLTGCDGKIREATALKIKELILKQISSKNFFAKIGADKFADGTIDINANICRLVIDSAALLIEYPTFAKLYTDKIVHIAQDSLEELDKFIFKDKKYVINKQLFKLYWCLEALSIFYNYADTDTLNQILLKSSSQIEYTIREKAALVCMKSKKFKEIAKKLKKDDNYYVRNIFIS